MLRNAATKPKLSLSINTQTVNLASKPKLALNTLAASPFSSACSSAVSSPASSLSPLPTSPTVLNTSLNRRAATFTTVPSALAHLQVPTYSYNYVNSSTAKSILKKSPSSASSATSESSKARKRLQINSEPTAVHAVTPIDDVNYWYKPVRGRW